MGIPPVSSETAFLPFIEIHKGEYWIVENSSLTVFTGRKGRRYLQAITTSGGLPLIDVLEISVGEKKYILANFVLTPIVHGRMLGGSMVAGCMIDSAEINGIRTAIGQNMTIHKGEYEDK